LCGPSPPKGTRVRNLIAESSERGWENTGGDLEESKERERLESRKTRG